MAKPDYPITPAVRLLREKKVAFEPHLYDYEERGGTRRSSEALGVAEHSVIKTLVMESSPREPFIILMHGDCEVSTKQLARALGVKSVTSCDAGVAQKHTGYQVGGTSPFGTRSRLPVYAEKSIFDLPRIYINGGKRGFLVEIDPRDLRSAIPVAEVEVAIPREPARD
ncbi:MAG TPA: aminoacyl-tRNA deacylase [Blastocatellia bacterium]|nr:aminoacyl-tRNA deacylase [Blastocatellia bacterium]